MASSLLLCHYDHNLRFHPFHRSLLPPPLVVNPSLPLSFLDDNYNDKCCRLHPFNMSTPNNDGNNGGSVGGKSFDRHDKSGRVFTQQEREAKARKKGVCVHCSRKTHNKLGPIRTPLTNDHVHEGLCIEHNLNVVPPTVAERWRLQFQQAIPATGGGNVVNQNPDGLDAVDENEPTTNLEIPLNIVQIPIGSFDDASTVTNSQQLGVDAMDKPTEVIERTVKDGNGKVGKYTGKCRIEKNTSTGRPVHIPTGQGRMKYLNNSVYDGEWEDGLWHGHGTFTTTSGSETYDGEWIKGKRDGLGEQLDSEGNQYVGEWKDDVEAGAGSFNHHSGWTVEGQWEKDRCTECISVGGLTVANYESAYEWAQQQDATVIIPPLVEAIEGLGINFPRFLGGKKRQTALHVASKAGDMDEVKRLLEDGAEVDKESKDGFTALDIVILNVHLDIARELCEKMNIDTDWLDGIASSLLWAAGLGRLKSSEGVDWQGR